MLWFLFAHWHSDRRRIAHRLDQLADLLDKGGEESDLAALATARRVTDFFAPGFVATARPYEGRLTEPRDLIGAVYRFRGSAPRIDVTLHLSDLEVRENRTAVVDFTASVVLHRPNGPARESRRVHSTWREDDGVWRMNEVELGEETAGSGLPGF